MSPPPVLARVRKLLALATSPNPHEAANAAARAHALIEAHRLQDWLAAEHDVTHDAEPIEDAADTPLDTARRIRPWKTRLASVLAEAHGCIAYTLHRDGAEHLVLIGRARDRAAVGELWGWLVKRIEWLSATHGPNRSRQWHEAFRIGVVDAVAERLDDAAGDARATFETAALVRVDAHRAAHREALDRFVAERLRLTPGRGRPIDARAWARGRAHADALDLPPRKPSS